MIISFRFILSGINKGMAHSIITNNGWEVIDPNDMATGLPSKAINDNFISLAAITDNSGHVTATGASTVTDTESSNNVVFCKNNNEGITVYGSAGDDTMHRFCFDGSAYVNGVQIDSNGFISDGSNPSIDTNARQLLAGDGVMIDWNNPPPGNSNAGLSFTSGSRVMIGQYYAICDVNAADSIDTNSRYLYDANTSTVVLDWSGNDGSTSIGMGWYPSGGNMWFGNPIIQANDTRQVSIDTNNRLLCDNGGYTTIDWQNQQLKYSNGMDIAIDWSDTPNSAAYISFDNNIVCLWGAFKILNDYTAGGYTPAEGMIGWDFTNHKLMVYNGSAWQTVSAT